MGSHKKKVKQHNQNSNGQNTLKSDRQTNQDAAKEDIKEAILEALREYEKERGDREKATQNSETKHRWIDTVRLILCMPFVKRETVKGNETLKMLTASFLAMLFGAFRIIGLFASVFSVVMIVYVSVTENLGKTFFFNIFFFLVMGFVSYLFAGLFRRVSIEVDNIEDESIVIALFAAVGTWVSIIFTAIAVFK
ncbi:MAG: hypothetical protein IK038_10340 [Bacteroidaceae bacterium]|nr:hypothetical protein [Bacteroidaceae bacterium]